MPLFPYRHNQKGMALLITLSIITLCITVAMELNRRTRSALLSAAFHQKEYQLYQMASAGLHVAMALLIKDKADSQIDSVQEDWANQDKISEFIKEIFLEEGRLELEISDESGRIQLNALVTYPDGRNFNAPQLNLWHRFLEYFQNQQQDEEQPQNEDSHPAAITNSIKDWIDTGDDDAVTGLSGAESEYYQSLDPPYDSRNGPFRHPDELLRVKGITPELYHGKEDLPGIRDSITIHGMGGNGSNPEIFDGKININTAPLPVLVALLPPGYEDVAEALVTFRSEMEALQFVHNLSDSQWYKGVPGLSDVDIDPKILKTSSDVFRIRSSAVMATATITLTAIVKREQVAQTGKWHCRIINQFQN